MANCETIKDLIEVYQQLQVLKEGELKYLTTAQVGAKSLDAAKPIQKDLDNAIGSLSVVYLFSFLEDQGFNLSNAFLQRLDDAKRLKMKAWKHIRHSAGHGFQGARVKGKSNSYDSEFESVWNADSSFSSRVHFDISEDKIFLDKTAGLSFLEDLISIFADMIRL